MYDQLRISCIIAGLAGWLLVGGALTQPSGWLPLCGASMAIYAAGIALNDVFDYEIDRVERPNRPLPSGRVSRRFASVLGWGLLILGILLAGASGSLASLAVGAALAVRGASTARRARTRAEQAPVGPAR